MTPPMIAPRLLLLLLLLLELWFSVELVTVDDDEALAASLVGVTVGDDGVELAVADREDDVEIVSAVTEDEDVLVVDVGVL